MNTELLNIDELELFMKACQNDWRRLKPNLSFDMYLAQQYHYWMNKCIKSDEEQMEEFLDKTRQAIDESGGCSTCGDLSGFECICEDDDDHVQDHTICMDCDQPDACGDFGCAIKQGLHEPLLP